MKKTITILAAIALLLSLAATANAQTRNYRDPGYKGSISLTDQYLVFLGLETSHGYMFDSNNYLGAGANYSFPLVKGKVRPNCLTTFVDYHRYMSDSPSSLVLGAKAGYMFMLGKENNANDGDPYGSFYAEPNVGWSWTLGNGCGLTASVGAALYTKSQSSGNEFLAMPKLTVGFEF